MRRISKIRIQLGREDRNFTPQMRSDTIASLSRQCLMHLAMLSERQ